jgi:hypothetical protein
LKTNNSNARLPALPSVKIVLIASLKETRGGCGCDELLNLWLDQRGREELIS